MALVVIAALMAAACGGASTPTTTATASAVGVARTFCDATGESFPLIDGFDRAVEMQQVGFSPLADAVLELAPRDAPLAFTRIYELLGSLGRSIAYVGVDEVDPELLEQVQNADWDAFGDYVRRQCPELNLQVNGLLVSQSSLLAGRQSETVERGAEPEPTKDPFVSAVEAVMGTPTAVPNAASVDAEPAAGGVQVEMLTHDSATSLYRATSFVIDNVWSSNAVMSTWTSSEPELDNQQHLVVEMYIETNAHDLNVTDDLFSLTGPDGRRTGVANQYLTTGERDNSLNLDNRDSVTLFLDFVLREPITDLTGWTIGVGRGDEVTTALPLIGAVPRDYPLGLDTGQTATDIEPAVLSGCPDEILGVTVAQAQVSLAAGLDSDLRWADQGQRWLTIELLVRNDGTDENCETGVPIFTWDPRLVVDDRPIAAADTEVRIEYVLKGATDTLTMLFQIPVDATTLELVGETGVPLASWTPDLPAVFGE